MLYIIGLGLADEKDVSVKGLEIIRKADRVYLEAYTAILLVDKEQLVSTPRSRSWFKVANAWRYSSKHTMGVPSSSLTAKWSNHKATKFSKMLIRRM
jgi:hypothetical protein